jgi:ABC-type polysaccharide/polyol phosphate export permease
MNQRNTALRDFMDGISRWNLAFFLAWGDTKARYKRSVLGPFWMVLSTAISVTGLGFLWSILLKDDPAKLVPSLTIGLVIWQFFSVCILEGPSIFYRNAHFIKNITLPYSLFILQLIFRQLIYFAHNCIVIVFVMIWFRIPLDLHQLLIIPGLLIVLLNLFWVILILSMLGARFRDFEQIIGAIMPLLFFLSPVIYRPSQLKFAHEIVWLNPCSYVITLIRDPLTGVTPPSFVYITSIVAIVVGFTMALLLFGKHRKNIAFWV